MANWQLVISPDGKFSEISLRARKKTSSSDLSARAMRISETLLIWGVGALSTHQTTLPRSLTAFGVQLFVAAAGLNGLQEAQLTQFSQSPVSFHVRKLQKITCSCRV